jgi:hypothetical protein
METCVWICLMALSCAWWVPVITPFLFFNHQENRSNRGNRNHLTTKTGYGYQKWPSQNTQVCKKWVFMQHNYTNVRLCIIFVNTLHLYKHNYILSKHKNINAFYNNITSKHTKCLQNCKDVYKTSSENAKRTRKNTQHSGNEHVSNTITLM